MMDHGTILYISDATKGKGAVCAAIKETGCDVLSANSPTEGVAMLYIMRTCAAVVIDDRAREEANFDLAQSLRKIDPGVPVLELCSEHVDSSSARADACVSTDKLASAIQQLLGTLSRN
jgi:DNA-binding NtrC family response regulator